MKKTPKPIVRRTCVIVAVALLFGAAAGAGVERTKIVGTDDWPATSLLDPGVMSCEQGEVVWVDPITPTCPGGWPLRIQESLGYSCNQASTVSGAPESRFTGVASFSVNATLNAGYSGRVWGVWMLVPSDTCDPALLVDPEEFWEGTWHGDRALVCSNDQCSWLGALKFAGDGYGGTLEGQRYKGDETVETFSPLPLPIELLGMCLPSAPCPAEGRVVGTIRKK